MTWPIDKDRWVFLLMIGLFVSAPPVAINIFTPAIPAVAADLAVPLTAVQAAVGLFMGGYAIGMGLFGPLSDAFGRRPALIAAALLFVLAAAGIMASGSASLFLLMVALQGFTAGGISVIGRTILRDYYEGPLLAQKMSIALTVLNVIPVVVPSIGALLLAFGGWRLPFTFTLAYAAFLLFSGLFLLQGGSNRPERSAIQPRRVLRSYVRVLADRNAALYSLVNAIAFAAFAIFFATLAPVVILGFQQSPSLAALYIALVSGGAVCGSLVNSRLVKRFPVHGVIWAGAGLAAAAAYFCAAMDAAGAMGLALYIGALVVVCFGTNLIIPNTTSLAIACHPKTVGVAASVLGVIQTAFASLMTSLIVLVHQHTAGSALAVIGTLALVGAGLLLLVRERDAVAAESPGPAEAKTSPP